MDTGATVDLMDMLYNILKNKGISLQRNKSAIFVYGSETPIKLKRQFQAKIETTDRVAISQIYAAACKGGNSLSAKTAQDVGLIHMVNTISSFP